jgi:CHAD domain-containing protein
VDLGVLKRAQDLLGRMHDLQVLVDRVRQMQASLTPPNLTVWSDLDAIVASLEDDCRRLHARYMRARGRLAATAGKLAAEPPARAVGSDGTRRVG